MQQRSKPRVECQTILLDVKVLQGSSRHYRMNLSVLVPLAAQKLRAAHSGIDAGKNDGHCRQCRREVLC